VELATDGFDMYNRYSAYRILFCVPSCKLAYTLHIKNILIYAIFSSTFVISLKLKLISICILLSYDKQSFLGLYCYSSFASCETCL
jgi:hypothetical protein